MYLILIAHNMLEICDKMRKSDHFGAASFLHTLQLAIAARGFVDDITHTTVASNCPALHIPRNRVDPTRGTRPFPRSSHAFNYRKERAWVPGYWLPAISPTRMWRQRDEQTKAGPRAYRASVT